MKFDEAVSISTQAADVEGIPTSMIPIVRRKVNPGYIVNKSKKRKKKNDSKKSN